jgi:hypothetical protein
VVAVLVVSMMEVKAMLVEQVAEETAILPLLLLAETVLQTLVVEVVVQVVVALLLMLLEVLEVLALLSFVIQIQEQLLLVLV